MKQMCDIEKRREKKEWNKVSEWRKEEEKDFGKRKILGNCLQNKD